MKGISQTIASSIIVAWLLLQAFSALAQQEPTHEIRAVFQLGGQPTGTYHESRKPGVNGEIVASIASHLIFNRMEARVELRSATEYYEDRDHGLTRIESDVSSSQQTIHTSATVDGSSLLIQTGTGGKTYDRTVPLTATLLGPDAARRLLLSHLRSPGDTVVYQTFSPDLGTVVTITSTLLGFEGPARKVEQTMSSMPGKSTLWLDEQGWMLRQVIPSALGEIEAVRSDSATAGATAGVTLPDETFSRSLITANIRLPQERLIERLKVKITHRRPDLGWPDLAADNQTVLEKTPGYLLLEIRRPAAPAEDAGPDAITPALEPYRMPNALLQSDDPGVQEIARAAANGHTAGWDAARSLVRWTNDNVKFDPGIAIVPASEVARNRRGTCFGYAMMLGSLARAAGIPSRIRMGLVYAGGIWGGHAWVDVRIGGRWIPVDGALYSPGPADAARFSFFTTSLEEGAVANLGALAQLFGSVDISILEYTVDGKTTVVPASARPYTVEGNTYRNPWAGITVAKPAAFQFTDLDRVWPSQTVVAMEGPDHQRLEISSDSASLPTVPSTDRKTYSADGTSVILRDGGNIWTLKATGPHAQRLLKEVAATIKLGR